MPGDPIPTYLRVQATEDAALGKEPREKVCGRRKVAPRVHRARQVEERARVFAENAHCEDIFWAS